MKNHSRMKILKDPISIRDAASKNVDTLFNDLSIIKNTSHIGFNKNFTNARFFQVTSYPQIGSHFAAKQ